MFFSKILLAGPNENSFSLKSTASYLSEIKKEVSLGIERRNVNELDKSILKINKILDQMSRAYENKLILKNKHEAVEYQKYLDFSDQITKVKVIIRICRAHTSNFHSANKVAQMNTLMSATSLLFEEMDRLYSKIPVL